MLIKSKPHFVEAKSANTVMPTWKFKIVTKQKL